MAISIEAATVKPDPFVALSEAAKRYRKDVNTNKGWFLGAQGAMGIAVMMAETLAHFQGAPDWIRLPAVGVIALGATVVHMRLFKRQVSLLTGEFNQIQEGIESQLEEDGVSGEGLTDIEYGLARKIRNTKLLLAQSGKLDAYQPGLWIESAPIPTFLKPRQEDLNEVDQWVDTKRRQEVDFVSGLSQNNRIVIACANESSGCTSIVLHGNEEGTRIDTMPLLDVMLLWEKTDQKNKEALEKAWSLRPPDASTYRRVDKDEQGQKLADFFNKPITLYSGARVYMRVIDRYGIGVKDFKAEQYRRAIYKEEFRPSSQQPELAIA